MTDDTITKLPANIRIEPLKSWRTFRKQFSDAHRLKAVTFCDSPSLLLDFFDEHGLDTMEVVVGDIGPNDPGWSPGMTAAPKPMFTDSFNEHLQTIRQTITNQVSGQ